MTMEMAMFVIDHFRQQIKEMMSLLINREEFFFPLSNRD